MAKPKRKPDKEKMQKERFIETARELEVDETGEAFERAFEKVIRGRRQKNVKLLYRDQNP